MVHQGYIEPHNATAHWDEDDRIKVWTSTQGAFPVRTSTAAILDMDVSRIKVTPLEIGGGFGLSLIHIRACSWWNHNCKNGN